MAGDRDNLNRQKNLSCTILKGGVAQEFKAVLINIIKLDQITVCNVKGVSHSDKPTENYCPNLQFSPILDLCCSFPAHNSTLINMLHQPCWMCKWATVYQHVTESVTVFDEIIHPNYTHTPTQTSFSHTCRRIQPYRIQSYLCHPFQISTSYNYTNALIQQR